MLLYKQEHFRLRTGLSTVFPCSQLYYDKIIATVPPKIYSPRMIQKSILTTLDAVVDHGFGSTIIPTFEIEELRHNQKSHENPKVHSSLEILLSTLYNYIDENPDDMNSKKIIICVNNTEEETKIFDDEIENCSIDIEKEEDLDNIGGNYKKEESKEESKREESSYKTDKHLGGERTHDNSELIKRIDELENQVSEIEKERQRHISKSENRKKQIEKLREENDNYKEVQKSLMTKLEEKAEQSDLIKANPHHFSKEQNTKNLLKQHERDIERYLSELNSLKSRNTVQYNDYTTHHGHIKSNSYDQDDIKKLRNERDELIADLGKCMEEKDALEKLLELKNKEENEANRVDEANTLKN